MLSKEKSAYGGELLKKRKARQKPRPLDTKNTIHLVLRSSKAKGEWSFKKKCNEALVSKFTRIFASKYGLKILSMANVGNHLHFHLKLTNRYTYAPFIRALTGALAMAITGASRWNRLKMKENDRFWDYRPYTRVVRSFRAFQIIRDYLYINQLEGFGCSRAEARLILAKSNTDP